MNVRAWVRRLPPVARRDATIVELKRRNRALGEKIRRLREEHAALTDSLRRPREVWTPPPRERALELVRASGLFDAEWYLAQLTSAEHARAQDDPAAHFVDEGEQAGYSPHPAFVSDHYAPRRTRVPRARRPILQRPFLHYLDYGAAVGHSPHPLFDAKAYLAAHPESRTTPGGPVAHFISRGLRLQPTGAATGERWDDPAEFLAVAREAAEIVRDTRGFAHVVRDVEHFDAELEERTKARLREQPLPADPPTVSVIVPTKDRADMLGAALDSVLAQSYPHWQLIVVDDGSRDDTPALLERYGADARVEVLRHGDARGVAAARNAGLRRASGRYIAYLDSDNTWSPDFLELMVRHLVQSGDRVAYGVTALVEEGGEGRRLFRGRPFDRDYLRERSYIDCIVVVHERALLDRAGDFDENLRRNVDWDLLIRLAEHADFTLVPVIATQYDVWSERGDRITTHEPMAYRYVVQQRTLVDLDDVARAAHDRDPALMSVVVALDGDAVAHSVVTSVQQVRRAAAGPVEVVVVDAKSRPGVFTEIHAHLAGIAGVTIRRLAQGVTLEVARNVGLGLTRGRDVTFLHSGLWAERGWDAPLRRALESHPVVQPLVLTPGGAVWSAGVEYLAHGHRYLPWEGFSGDAPEVRREREVSAVSAAALAVRAVDIAAAGGFDPLMRNDLYGGELSMRIVTRTGGTAACVPASVVAWLYPVGDAGSDAGLERARGNQRREREVRSRSAPAPDPARALPGYRLVGFDRPSQVKITPRPVLVHDRPARPLRWAIKIGAPTVDVRTSWGDWHFAEALRDSLERLGHEVTIDSQLSWYRASSALDDVVLQLRGVRRYEVNPGHTNIIWTISHPDRVNAAELSDYDVAFGASARWCDAMTRRLGRPVAHLPQCTDHRRFHPVEPDARRAHEVLVVANARGLRPAVAAALDAGVVPAVYGKGWYGLVPDGAWQDAYIPNAELPAVYAAAGVVLNDHWLDMRETGMVSNRLFDAVACEARVVSDDLPEIPELFGDAVVTFGEHRDIGSAIARQLADTPERARARRELGAHVRSAHTFDARARQLSEAVAVIRTQQPC